MKTTEEDIYIPGQLNKNNEPKEYCRLVQTGNSVTENKNRNNSLIQVLIDPELKIEIKLYCIEKGITLGEFMREAVLDAYMRKQIYRRK